MPAKKQPSRISSDLVYASDSGDSPWQSSSVYRNEIQRCGNLMLELCAVVKQLDPDHAVLNNKWLAGKMTQAEANRDKVRQEREKAEQQARATAEARKSALAKLSDEEIRAFGLKKKS